MTRPIYYRHTRFITRYARMYVKGSGLISGSFREVECEQLWAYCWHLRRGRLTQRRSLELRLGHLREHLVPSARGGHFVMRKGSLRRATRYGTPPRHCACK